MDTRLPPWLLPVLILVVGGFVSVMDIAIVNISLPNMEKDFGVGTEDIQWVTTAYSLTLGVLVPASGWLGDRIGLRLVYLTSLVGFGVTSALCGLAWNLESIVAFRILQAIPGGILPMVSLTMLYRLVPHQEIGTAMGVYSLGMVFAPAIGPTLGGYLVDYHSWRWIFFINVPVCALGGVATWLGLPELSKPSRTPFDTWGFVTIGAGLFALLLAFTKAVDWGWTSYPIMMLIVGGVLCLGVFVLTELEVDKPLLDVRLFMIGPFTTSLILLVTLIVGLFVVLFYTPQFLEVGQNIQPLRAGLILLPEAIVMAVLAPVSGILYDKIGPRWPCVVGLGVAAWGTYLLAGITPDVPQSQIILWSCIRAAGNGLAMACIFTAGLAIVSPDKLSAAGAINNLGQRVVSALALAVLVALETRTHAQIYADRAALIRPHLTPHPPTPASLELAWTRLQLEVSSRSDRNVFIAVAIATAFGAIAALWMRNPTQNDDLPAGAEEATQDSATNAEYADDHAHRSSLAIVH